MPLLGEACSASKTLAVFLALSGATAIALTAGKGMEAATSPSSPSEAISGDALVLASAALYALKEVLYKRWLPDSSSSPSPLVDACFCVGIIGVGLLVGLPVYAYVLDATGIERWETPPLSVVLDYSGVALLMGAYQILLFAAIALTSPTLVAVGSLLVSPISMVWDIMDFGFVMPTPALAGVMAILTALILMLRARMVDRTFDRISFLPRTDSKVGLLVGS